MATRIAPSIALPRPARRLRARPGVSRTRRSVAAALEITLEPRLAQRRGLRSWPRIPRANRAVATEPLLEILALLRDPAITLPDDAVRCVLTLAICPTSALYGPYPNQALFAAHSLVNQLRARADGVAA
jgi:hypothetical protein